MTYEDRFLARLARGDEIAQDEYDSLLPDLAPEAVAEALVRRFTRTGEHATLAEAAKMYLHVGMIFEALEICSRYPNRYEFRRLTEQILPLARKAYHGTRMIGKLLDEAFLVIDLTSGQMDRYPPLMPATLEGRVTIEEEM